MKLSKRIENYFKGYYDITNDNDTFVKNKIFNFIKDDILKEIKQLEITIEKMKCGVNCKHGQYDTDNWNGNWCGFDESRNDCWYDDKQLSCIGCKDWELEDNENK